MKTKITTTLATLSTALSLLLVVAVFLTAAHAKDVVAAAPAATRSTDDQQSATRTVHDDLVVKSIRELHSHVDKTMVKDPGMGKSMSKMFGDNASLVGRREHDDTHEEQPLSVKLIEMMLMIRLTYAHITA